MPKRTRRQSIERCLKLWTYLAESGSSDKDEAYSACNFKINDSARCPACEYTVTHRHRYCNENCIIPWPTFYCNSSESPYHKWAHTINSEFRKKYARQIVILCKEALVKL